jgi:glycosyltransferase involved in cell wall biosynthesis
MIHELGVESSVTFTGMLSGALKWSAFAAATLFVLPSRSENFAVAISEAMAMSLPLIVTRQCNRPEVAEAGAGWIIEPDVLELSSALREALSLDDAGRAGWGRNGRRLAHETCSWQAIGADFAAVYEWILGLGPRPRCVTGGPGEGGCRP